MNFLNFFKEQNRDLLYEMAYDKRRISQIIGDRTDEVIQHLILCFIYRDLYEDTINHWTTEIYSMLNRSYKYTKTKSYPTVEQLNKWCLVPLKDTIKDRINSTANSYKVLKKYKTIPEFNKDLIYNLILEYFQWLFNKFEINGNVELEEVRNEINYLITKI